MNNIWPILIGIFVVAHFWMMFKGDGGHSGANTEDETDDVVSGQKPKTKDEDSKHKHGGCCH